MRAGMSRSTREDEPDGDVDDEDRLAAVLAVLALTRREATPIGSLARWRAQRLAALREPGPSRPGGRGPGVPPMG
jgi:hypothetical protein